MQKPVLFLDFDGPLFPERVIGMGKSISAYPYKLHPFINYWEMDATSVRQLNALYEIYQFDTVISSSWRHFIDDEQTRDLFTANKLNLHIHADWRTPSRMSSYRVNEIAWWLDEYERKGVAPSHIILDDPWSGTYLDSWKDHGLCEPILVNPEYGISTHEFKVMKSIVTSWAEDHKSRVYTREIPDREYKNSFLNT